MPLKPRMVSLSGTYLPGAPVKTSATWHGWLKKRSILRARGAGHGLLVLFAQLVHAQDRDDVLELLVLLQRGLDLARDLVVLGSDHVRVELARGGVERVDRRVDAQRGDVARQHHGGVEVGEG